MFTLDELVVKMDEEDCYESLIELRARLFYSKTSLLPTVIFVSNDVWFDIVKTIAERNRYNFANPSIQSLGLQNFGLQKLICPTSYGDLPVKVISQTKSFLLVGIESTFSDLDYSSEIPRELWSSTYRMAIDEIFESEVLK